MTNETDKAKDTKATRVPGTLDNATGKRKKKKLVGLAQTGPRRLVPKKMVAKINIVVVEQEHVAQEIDWIWGCEAEKPVEEDVAQEQRDSTSAGHVVEEHRILDASSLPTCSRHRKKKTNPVKTRRKVKATPSAQDNVTSDTTSTNTDDYKQNKESSDQRAQADAVEGISGKDEGRDDHKEPEQDKGKCKDKEHNPDNMATPKQDVQRAMEEERRENLGKRLRKDLEKGLRMQKNLHMKLHSQLKSQKDLDMTKAILTELEKGLRLQKMVENELRMRKEQEQGQEHGLDESSLLRVKICEDSGAARALTLTVDIQAPAA